MGITKIDGVSHYKMKESGILKKSKERELSKDLTEEKIRETVEKRYEKTIESKIYKEFIKLKSGRIENLVNEKKLSDLEENIETLKYTKSLYFLIKELYSEDENENWNLNFEKFSLSEVLNKKEIIVKGYKFKKKDDEYPYLYKDKEGNESESAYHLLKNLIEKNLGKGIEEIRKSEEYTKAKENFLN